MKKIANAFLMIIGMLFCLGTGPDAIGAPLKPFILASQGIGTIAGKLDAVKGVIQNAGFQVVGEYTPYDNVHVIAITNKALTDNAAQSELGAYGAVLRISLTQVKDQLQVTYTNPVYMANAYRMKADLTDLTITLVSALGKEIEFGSKDGLEPDSLRKYHYMMLMPYFTDQTKLASFGSYQDAVEAVENGLAAGKGGAAKVYRVDIPGKEESVFGVAISEGDGADKTVMTTIDINELKHTPHLPYDLVVSGGDVLALHGKFRIAVNFPDLTMGTFMQISGAPGGIENSLKQAAAGK